MNFLIIRLINPHAGATFHEEDTEVAVTQKPIIKQLTPEPEDRQLESQRASGWIGWITNYTLTRVRIEP